MDAGILSQLQGALTESLTILGDSFTYPAIGGSTYTGIINAIELSTELVDGGLMETLATQIIFPVAVLNTSPVAGQTLFVGSQKMRIHKVSIDDLAYELICTTATK